MKKKQRAREVISQSSNAQIRYALQTTFTHHGENTNFDDDPGKQEEEEIKEEFNNIKPTIIYPNNHNTAPRYLSYHYHHPNHHDLLVENSNNHNFMNKSTFQPVYHQKVQNSNHFNESMWFQSLPPPPPVPQVQNYQNMYHYPQFQYRMSPPQVQGNPDYHCTQVFAAEQPATNFGFYPQYSQPVHQQQHPPSRERSPSSSSSRKLPMSVTFV